LPFQYEKRRLGLPSGVDIALTDWGGEGPPALLHHANGFCAATLGLVAAGLRDRYQVFGIDARGHGDSTQSEDLSVYRWQTFADDLIAVAEAILRDAGANPIGLGAIGLGVGHSLGATTTLFAASQRPELFRQLLLIEPVVPPCPDEEHVDPDRPKRLAGLIEAARRRRSHWPDRASARAHFARRPLFEHWRPEALDLYVREGLRDDPGGGVSLKCPGPVEAAIFASGERVDVLGAAKTVPCPTTIVWAARGNFVRARYEALAAAMKDARIVDVAAGHLVPMERPDLVLAALDSE